MGIYDSQFKVKQETDIAWGDQEDEIKAYSLTRGKVALTLAGVGKVSIVDRDYVGSSNLQRQQLYTEQDVEDKLPKAESAKRHLHAINHEVDVEVVIKDASRSIGQCLRMMFIHQNLLKEGKS